MGRYSAIKCYVCNSVSGDACDESNTGDVQKCDNDNSCMIGSTTESNSAMNYFERACTGPVDVGVGCATEEKTLNGVTVTAHVCICDSNECNKNWETAGSATLGPAIAALAAVVVIQLLY